MAGIYIHIPFCKTKCIYCEFYSLSNKTLINEYLESISSELFIQKGFFWSNDKIETIYFGGGTPSLLDVNGINSIIKEIKKHFVVIDSPEITIEVNPDDISESYVEKLKESFINRISIGIQSFNDDELKYLERRHTAQQARKAIELLQENGFKNLSIDLIFGLPDSTMQIWQSSINEVLKYKIHHISVYALTVEEGTKLYKAILSSKISGPNEDKITEQYSYAMKALKENGYSHYEVSNFCKPDSHSRHNSNYWKGIKYLGLGPSAHSYDGNKRYWNFPDFNQYQEAIKTGNIASDYEVLTESDRYNEFILTSLRTEGVDINDLKERFDSRYAEYFMDIAKEMINKKDIVLEDDVFIIPSTRKLFADKITSELFYVE